MKTEYKIEWNKRGCGRCGGTGFYQFMAGAATKGICYDCRGRGYTMSPKTRANMEAYREWRQAENPTLEAILAALKSGRFGKAFRLIEKDAPLPTGSETA